MILAGVGLGVAGIFLIMVGRATDSDELSLAELIPWTELGGILIGAGLLGIWIDRFFQREQQAADEERLRQLMTEHAPVMRDAVLQAFAAGHADLERVAIPETLDGIITNSLGLRLEDQTFAEEIYADLTNQVINPPERWHDAQLDIDLTPAEGLDGYFTVTARWEYTITPKRHERRFVCTGDRAEYAEIAQAKGDTSAWYFKPDEHLNAKDPQAFELLTFLVNGQEQRIRRSSRKNYQAYTVHLDEALIEANEPVKISYTTRTVTEANGHLLFFEIEQPTHGINVSFDYAGCDIAAVGAIDLVPSVLPTRIEHSPDEVPTKTVRVEIDGWTFPRSGVAFVRTLSNELSEAPDDRQISQR